MDRSPSYPSETPFVGGTPYVRADEHERVKAQRDELLQALKDTIYMYDDKRARELIVAYQAAIEEKPDA